MSDVTKRPQRGSRNLPSLDGLRALSIGLVVLAHYAGTRGAVISLSVQRFVDWGMLGVRVFFVISGFLITSLLLAEAERYGTINLRAFYWRRTMRIFPAYYTYLACIAIAAALGLIVVPSGAFLHAATYLTNYKVGAGWYLGHSWSLSVEEQFYLLWPAAMLFAGRRHAWKVTVAVILLAPVIRVVEYHLRPGAPIYFHFETTADALATGCLLAYAREWLAGNETYARVRKSGALYLLLPIAAAGVSLGQHPHLAFVVGDPVTNLALGFLVDWTVREPNTLIGRVLNTTPLAVVGRMSYSLYLWQQPFLNRNSSGWATASPVNLVLAACAAALSYLVIEQPALRLRQRLSAVRLTRPAVLPES